MPWARTGFAGDWHALCSSRLMNNLGLSLCQRGPAARLGRAGCDFGVALLCISLGLAAAAPKSAHACLTLPPPPALVGYPAEGQADVPTDVVPFYSIFDAGISDVAMAQFELTSSEGAVIAVQAKQLYAWHAELLPSEPLQPNTEYRVEVSLPNGESVRGVSFRTGAGPFEGKPPPPNASLQHYQFAPDVIQTSCSPSQTGTCVALAGAWPTEVTDLWNGNANETVYLYEGSFFTNLSGLDQGTPFDCVRLRSRAPNGVYSTPVELCRGDGPLLILTGNDRITCTAEGLQQEPTQPGTPSAPEKTPSEPSAAADGAAGAEGAEGANESTSCSLTAPGVSGTWHPFMLLLAGAACLGARASRPRNFRHARTKKSVRTGSNRPVP